ncbi:hypothetical protein NMY22_g10402 [Coprinellus aureogranulatus]|nr:hypothetical protein NMY22_g10402 [Coprinellus aureogranulatus]
MDSNEVPAHSEQEGGLAESSEEDLVPAEEDGPQPAPIMCSKHNELVPYHCCQLDNTGNQDNGLPRILFIRKNHFDPRKL